jgi:hypothetical protein
VLTDQTPDQEAAIVSRWLRNLSASRDDGIRVYALGLMFELMKPAITPEKARELLAKWAREYEG